MSRKQNGRVSGRLIYLATLVAIVGVTGGVAMGVTILAPTTVNQTAGMYEGANQAPTGYNTTPTLSIANIPASVSACTVGPVTETTTAATIDVYFSDSTAGTTCTTGDFAELFTVSYSATPATAQTDQFTITTSYGTGPTVGYNSLNITTGTGAWTQTINVYVDYGSPNMPAGGIDTLTLVIQ